MYNKNCTVYGVKLFLKGSFLIFCPSVSHCRGDINARDEHCWLYGCKKFFKFSSQHECQGWKKSWDYVNQEL